MSMTPEEIDEIYIQEHGMTKGAFSVGLQGSLMHRNSVEEWAEGDPVKVWLEGKDIGEKSTVCIAYEIYFFRHINNETAGAFLGCRVLPAPRRAPYI